MTTEQTQQRALPMFYQEVVALDMEQHGGLKLDRGRSFVFAQKSNAMPLAIGEFAAAALEYPIVFGAPAYRGALAVLGFRDKENLFVDAEGAWRTSSYIPAYVRNYPFMFIEGNGTNLILGVDPTANSLKGTSGLPLFENGQPTAVVKEAMDFCIALQQSLNATAEFCSALDDAGVLVENRAKIDFAGGGSATLDGFRIIDQAKFDALDEQRFLDWRRRGWLAAVYAHFFSMAQWRRLADLSTKPSA